MSSKTPSFKKLDQRQIQKILNLLDAHCATTADGKAVYAEGWSDKRIGDEALPGYPGNAEQAVAFRRNNLFGALAAQSRRPQANYEMEDRLSSTEARLVEVIEFLVTLGFKPAEIQSQLALSK